MTREHPLGPVRAETEAGSACSGDTISEKILNLERFNFKRHRQVSALSQPQTAQVWVMEETQLLAMDKKLGVLLCREGRVVLTRVQSPWQ